MLERSTGRIEHARTADLPNLLTPGDLLVVNDTRVIPARLHGHRDPSGGRVECLLLGPRGDERWEALVHPGQKLRPGTRMRFEGGGLVLHGEVLERFGFGRRTVRLWREDRGDVAAAIDAIGEVPLPPYIKRPIDPANRERYRQCPPGRPALSRPRPPDST